MQGIELEVSIEPKVEEKEEEIVLELNLEQPLDDSELTGKQKIVKIKVILKNIFINKGTLYIVFLFSIELLWID